MLVSPSCAIYVQNSFNNIKVKLFSIIGILVNSVFKLSLHNVSNVNLYRFLTIAYICVSCWRSSYQ